jgi:hypothetical protein
MLTILFERTHSSSRTACTRAAENRRSLILEGSAVAAGVAVQPPPGQPPVRGCRIGDSHGCRILRPVERRSIARGFIVCTDTMK